MVFDAAAWSPRSHQLTGKREYKAGWNVSFRDAFTMLHRNKREKVQEFDIHDISYGDEASVPCYNHDSSSFFQRMKVSHQEVDRLRQQCRLAARSNPARGQEQRPNMANFALNVESARQISDFGSVPPFCREELGLPGEVAQKIGLGHLQVPKASAVQVRQAMEVAYIEPHSNPNPLQHAPLEVAETVRSGSSTTPVPSSFVGLSQSPSPPLGAPTPETPLPPTVILQQAAPALLQETDAGAKYNRHQSLGGQSASDGIDDGSNDGDVESLGSAYSSVLMDNEWPPKPPLMRFKVVMQFSKQYEPRTEEEKMDLRVKRQQSKIFVQQGEAKPLTDMTIGWFNLRFATKLATEFEFEVGFPTLLLFMLDAVYRTKVPWQKVDWRFQYKDSYSKNFVVLYNVWQEVGMDKARGFRVSDTSLRLDTMQQASLQEKLLFMKMLKKWFDTRIHAAPPYDPNQRRHEFVESCRLQGHKVEFPAWIPFDKDEAEWRVTRKSDWDLMPEYQRLNWFMGDPAIQAM